MAEAGFFPGVVYYLTLWFPKRMRARAVSRFYVALPLSSVVMGGLAGWLLGLNGKLGWLDGNGCFCWRVCRRWHSAW